MTRRVICDGCRRDMTEDAFAAADVYSPGNVTPVIACITWRLCEGSGKDVDICVNCVIDAFSKLDRRPKKEATHES